MRLSQIAEFSGGKTPSTTNSDYWNGSVNWTTSKDMKSKYIDSTLTKMSELGARQMQVFPPKTLLMVVRSGILRRTLPMAILRQSSTVNQDIKTVSFYVDDVCEFIYNYFLAQEGNILTKYSKSGTTVESINFEELKNILIPLPPLFEQHRIVAVIEATFATIDEIEQNKSDLQTAVTAAKNKILSLAIRGKLVPQEPSDEPASVLLECIRAEREQLIKAGKIKRGKADSVIVKSDDNSYYAGLLKSWAVCRFDEVLEYEQPTQYIVESTEYSHKNKTPVLTAGKSFIIGYTNEDTGICSDLPVIIFDDFTTECKYVDFPFKVKSSAMKILRSKCALLNYLYYFMQTVKCNHTTHKRYWISDYSQKLLALPPLSEQERIVAAIETSFEQLDSITVHLS